MFKKFLNWLVVSSEDPTAISLTVRGLLVTAVPYIIGIAGFAHFQTLASTTPDIYNVLINYIVQFINDALTAIGSVMAIYGILRKLFNTHVPEPANVVTTPLDVIFLILLLL